MSEIGRTDLSALGGNGPAGSAVPPCGPAIGVFEGTVDIGGARAGATVYNPASGLYRITGGGAGMWDRADALHLAWRRFQGDGAVSADIAFAPGQRTGREMALLLLRQSFDPGAAYAGLVLHGDGRMMLQYRQAQGAPTWRVITFEPRGARFSLRRAGGRITVLTGSGREGLREAAMVVLPLRDPLIVGIGVCAHDLEGLATAHFSRVRVGLTD